MLGKDAVRVVLRKRSPVVTGQNVAEWYTPAMNLRRFSLATAHLVLAAGTLALVGCDAVRASVRTPGTISSDQPMECSMSMHANAQAGPSASPAAPIAGFKVQNAGHDCLITVLGNSTDILLKNRRGYSGSIDLTAAHLIIGGDQVDIVSGRLRITSAKATLTYELSDLLRHRRLVIDGDTLSLVIEPRS